MLITEIELRTMIKESLLLEAKMHSAEELIELIKKSSKIRGGSSASASDSAPHQALKPSDFDENTTDQILVSMSTGGPRSAGEPLFKYTAPIFMEKFLDSATWWQMFKGLNEPKPEEEEEIQIAKETEPKPRPCGERASKGWEKYCGKGPKYLSVYQFWKELSDGIDGYDESFGSFVKFYNNIRQKEGDNDVALGGMTVGGVEVVVGKHLGTRDMLKIMKAAGESFGAGAF